MKLLICESDAMEKILCNSCKQKLDRGEISALDVESSQELAELSKRFPLHEVELLKSLELDGTRLLLCKGSIAPLIGREGKVVSELSKRFNQRVRIVEKSADLKKCVQDLIGNIRLLGINELHSPKGVLYRVIFSKKDQQKMGFSEASLQRAVQEIVGRLCVISFE